MGILSKRPKQNKIYPLKKAMEIVSKNEGYSVVQEEDGYRIISDKTAREHIERYKDRKRQKDAFTSGLQTGYTNIPMREDENSNYRHRYGYHEEER